VNFFGDGAVDGCQNVVFDNFDGESEQAAFDFFNRNLEAAPLPFDDASFDCVLFCEVLEHLTGDPLRAVLELKRVLKPGGVMVLTTPNAARLENVIAFIEGRNMYDPYSGYGPYGRHNREYTRHELHQLMVHAGFEAEVSFTANVHDDVPPTVMDVDKLNALLGGIAHRDRDLGQYLITRWRNAGEATRGLPRWLYRSYPEESFA
jgi:SAM-dependent methyltransferase